MEGALGIFSKVAFSSEICLQKACLAIFQLYSVPVGEFLLAESKASYRNHSLHRVFKTLLVMLTEVLGINCKAKYMCVCIIYICV